MSAPVIRPGAQDVARAVRRLHVRRIRRRILSALAALILIAALLLGTAFRPAENAGRAMLPALDDGQLIFVNSLDRTPERGQLIRFTRDGETFVRRVAALPGDAVALTGGVLSVNGGEVCRNPASADMPATLTVPAHMYFVIADNPAEGMDSRTARLGLVVSAEVEGVVW